MTPNSETSNNRRLSSCPSGGQKSEIKTVWPLQRPSGKVASHRLQLPGAAAALPPRSPNPSPGRTRLSFLPQTHAAGFRARPNPGQPDLETWPDFYLQRPLLQIRSHSEVPRRRSFGGTPLKPLHLGLGMAKPSPTPGSGHRSARSAFPGGLLGGLAQAEAHRALCVGEGRGFRWRKFLGMTENLLSDKVLVLYSESLRENYCLLFLPRVGSVR